MPRSTETTTQPTKPLPGNWFKRIDPVVFGVTGALAVAFIVWGALNTPGLAAAASAGKKWVVTNTGWLFVVAASFFVVFVIWLALSKFGRVPLGKDGEPPEFKTISWIAMMFSAGMGIGLMFFGVAEPLSFYASPPPGTADPQTQQAMKNAMATTMFHWGLHPWAIYAVVGLAIAYSTFRRGRKQLISSTFFSIFGRNTTGPAGKIIDMLAIFATLFGSAASLGLGAIQIGQGIAANGWGASSAVLQVSIVVILTILFIASAVSGIERGIQWLSNINMILAVLLALFVFVVGPTLFILNLIPTTVGEYLGQMAAMVSRTAAAGPEMGKWVGDWTIFYWAWWVSWTPFVGMFIARISRGRTIRQFVGGVLLVPSVVSLLWFSVFGGAGIFQQQRGAGLVGAEGVSSQNALFDLLKSLTNNGALTTIVILLVMILIGIFFVSGADAASIVMGSLSERGTTSPSRVSVIIWGGLTGAVAAIMLWIGSAYASPDDPNPALNGLQSLTIVAALPFVLVMVLMCVALVRDLQSDPLIVRQTLGVEAVEEAVRTGVKEHDGEFSLVVEAANGVEATKEPELEAPTTAQPPRRAT